MTEIIFGTFFGLLLGICIFGVIDIERQIRRIKDPEKNDDFNNSKKINP